MPHVRPRHPARTGRQGADSATPVTAADSTSITRIRDQFLDSQYRDTNTTENGDSTSSTLLSQVQAGLDEPTSSGLSGQLDTFFQNWA